jgi:mono/diheme cytochrome c family protein
MPASSQRPFVVGAVALILSGVALAQQQTDVDYGKAEYAANCSGCHGPGGAGDGHFREFLNRAPADLTRLARANGGVFPAQRVQEIIDGRRAAAGHGAAGEMPIWGASYMIQARSDPRFTGGAGAEAYARGKVALLVDYLNRIQVR